MMTIWTYVSLNDLHPPLCLSVLPTLDLFLTTEEPMFETWISKVMSLFACSCFLFSYPSIPFHCLHFTPPYLSPTKAWSLWFCTNQVILFMTVSPHMLSFVLTWIYGMLWEVYNSLKIWLQQLLSYWLICSLQGQMQDVILISQTPFTKCLQWLILSDKLSKSPKGN